MNRIVNRWIAYAFGSAVVLTVAFARAATETVVYSFCSKTNCADGSEPYAALTNVKGMLYGTTFDGGSGSRRSLGTVFSIDPATGTETALHTFAGGHRDGAHPLGRLLYADGVLFGTTSAHNSGFCRKLCGTVFSIDPATGAEKVLHFFEPNGTDGYGPYAGVIKVKGKLYGTTGWGGTQNIGTVFSLDLSSGAEKVLHSFQSGDGAEPLGDLVDVDGTLYGTTYEGGAHGYGTVFSIDPATGAFVVLHSFNLTDGATLMGSLTSVNGVLYGTTISGGSGSPRGGTVFAIDPATGTETVLHSFCSKKGCQDGDWPVGDLINVNGVLYGATFGGGVSGGGTVFLLDPATDNLKVLYSFQYNSTDGQSPEAGLVPVNHTFYGTTRDGGASNCSCGTVYSIAP